MEPDGDGNLVRLPDSRPPLTPSYRDRLLLLAEAGLAESKLSTKRSRPEKEGTKCVQTTLKKRKTSGALQKAETGTGAHNMKNEDIGEKSEDAVFLL